MRDATARRLSRLHVLLFRASRGRIGSRLVDNDMLLLTTTGRTSGKNHQVPLLYLPNGEGFVVIASWGGRDYHPDWYLNLLAEPAATVDIGSTTRNVTARVANAEERATWMERAQQAHSGYEEYQRRTERPIPIVFLEPAADGGRPRW